jgi:hypothetical protein
MFYSIEKAKGFNFLRKGGVKDMTGHGVIGQWVLVK